MVVGVKHLPGKLAQCHARTAMIAPEPPELMKYGLTLKTQNAGKHERERESGKEN